MIDRTLKQFFPDLDEEKKEEKGGEEKDILSRFTKIHTLKIRWYFTPYWKQSPFILLFLQIEIISSRND